MSKDKYYCPECGDICSDITAKNKEGYMRIACFNCESVSIIKLDEDATKIMKT
jgi:transcription elongation factor Elf1